jgi:hypothetical protein
MPYLHLSVCEPFCSRDRILAVRLIRVLRLQWSPNLTIWGRDAVHPKNDGLNEVANQQPGERPSKRLGLIELILNPFASKAAHPPNDLV